MLEMKAIAQKIEQYTQGRRCQLSNKNQADRGLIAHDLAIVLINYQRRQKANPWTPPDDTRILNVFKYCMGEVVDKPKPTSFEIALLASRGILFGSNKKALEQHRSKLRGLIKQRHHQGRHELNASHSLLVRKLYAVFDSHGIYPSFDKVKRTPSAALQVLTDIFNQATGLKLQPSTIEQQIQKLINKSRKP